jgi:hypothetical protein
VDVLDFTLAFLVGSLLTPIPADDVVALISLAVSAIGEALFDGYMGEILTFLENFEDDIICILYDGLSATETKNSMTSLLSAELSFVAAVFLEFLLSFTNLNSLYEQSTLLTSLPNTVGNDCFCGNGWCSLVVQSGTIESEVSGTQIVIESEIVDGACSSVSLVGCSNLTNHTPHPGTSDFQFHTGDSDCVQTGSTYVSDIFPSNNDAGSGRSQILQFVGSPSTTFTVQLDFIS